MYKFLTVCVVFLLVAMAATGCAKKEAAEGELGMPMSVSVEGTGTTNLITKAGTPVEANTPTAPIMNEPTQMPEAPVAYVAPTVQEIQQALKNAGLYTGAVDGKLGPMTKKAVTEFQQQSGLVADGKVGSKTWEKLKAHLNQQ